MSMSAASSRASTLDALDMTFNSAAITQLFVVNAVTVSPVPHFVLNCL